MSKVKSSKRKNASLLKNESKVCSVKSESASHDKKGPEINVNHSISIAPSCSKTGSSGIETSSGACYESAINANANRESSDMFSSYMKNAILEEVLNAKKAALLQSPAVIKLLREEQLKKQRKN